MKLIITAALALLMTPALAGPSCEQAKADYAQFWADDDAMAPDVRAQQEFEKANIREGCKPGGFYDQLDETLRRVRATCEAHPDKQGCSSVSVPLRLAEFAGSHNRCPRFQTIDGATKAERAEAKISIDAYDGFSENINLKQYKEDPSAFCKRAWDQLGPNGTYKRQMLEAK